MNTIEKSLDTVKEEQYIFVEKVDTRKIIDHLYTQLSQGNDASSLAPIIASLDVINSRHTT